MSTTYIATIRCDGPLYCPRDIRCDEEDSANAAKLSVTNAAALRGWTWKIVGGRVVNLCPRCSVDIPQANR